MTTLRNLLQKLPAARHKRIMKYAEELIAREMALKLKIN